jgi:hypothetical protein
MIGDKDWGHQEAITWCAVVILCMGFLSPFFMGQWDGMVFSRGMDNRGDMCGDVMNPSGAINGADLGNFFSVDQGTYELTPPWDDYGCGKLVQEWGGREGWGARTQNRTQCEVNPLEGFLDIESRAFGANCLVRAWCGHSARWQCPQDGVYDITFNYSYSEGLSQAYYTIHEDFSGELRTGADLLYYCGTDEFEESIYEKYGKHNDRFQGVTSVTYQISCSEGREYVIGANLTLHAYTDSWDEAWSSSQIQARGILSRVTLTRVNNPPLKPSRPMGPAMGVTGRTYTYEAYGVDPDGDSIFYLFDWGDGTTSGWQGPYGSGEMGNASHIWHQGDYTVRVKIKDDGDEESEWSDPLVISMPVRHHHPWGWIIHTLKQFLFSLFTREISFAWGIIGPLAL